MSDPLFLSLTRRLFLPVDSFSTPITATVHSRFSPSSDLLMYRVKQYATRCMVCEKPSIMKMDAPIPDERPMDTRHDTEWSHLLVGQADGEVHAGVLPGGPSEV